MLDIPLRDLFPNLHPAVIKAAQRQPKPDDLLRIPLRAVQAQLATGSVKFSYEQLREMAPAQFFGSATPEGQSEVQLPLAGLLKHIKPEQLQRRANQKKLEAPDDIGPIFGVGGAGLRVATAKRPAAPGAPEAVPPAPPVPVPPPAPSLPVSAAPLPPPAAEPKPAPTAPAAPPPAPEPIKAPALDPSLAVFTRPPEKRPTFKLPLMDIASYWSSTGKNDLANLYRHEVEIPLDLVEAGLKKGKLVFTWKEFQQWVRLGSGAMLPQIAEEAQIELPLSIVAPRFLEAHAPRRTQKKLAVGSDIPDLFESKTPPPPVLPAPSPQVAAPAPITEAAPAPPKPLPEFGEIFGQPDKKSWTLQEVTQRCATLRGVAGALIATSDGLLVAGTWPGDVKGESVAAFVPQMHNRIQNYSKELKLGEPDTVTLTLENVPLQISRTGSSFLTVLGRAGENLPKAQIIAIATRLSQQNISK